MNEGEEMLRLQAFGKEVNKGEINIDKIHKPEPYGHDGIRNTLLCFINDELKSIKKAVERTELLVKELIDLGE